VGKTHQEILVKALPLLHIIAPNLAWGKMGGTENAFQALTDEFIRADLRLKIYLNPQAAAKIPQWREHVIPVRTGSMDSDGKVLSMLNLQIFGISRIPQRDLHWFPFGSICPLNFKGKAVVTMHDTIEKDIPRAVPIADRIFRWFNRPVTVKKATVVTSSDFSARQIKIHYGADAEVIRLPCSAIASRVYDRVPNKPYVFYPANAWPHKNHLFLLNLWSKFKKLQDFALVFTMSTGTEGLDSAIARAKQKGIDVQILGRLNREELMGLYEKAHCSVFPSLYEGFGLPVLESLQNNCPILVSDRGSLPEVAGVDYPFVLPLNDEDWARCILENPRQEMKDPRSFVPDWTWQQAAAKYIEVFSKISVR
jgi:glycosyltransferase involved in cell wall biosynthesis